MADRERFDEMRTLLKRQPHYWSVSMLELMSSIIDELTELDLRVDPPRLEGYRELGARAAAAENERDKAIVRAEIAERERDAFRQAHVGWRDLNTRTTTERDAALSALRDILVSQRLDVIHRIATAAILESKEASGA